MIGTLTGGGGHMHWTRSTVIGAALLVGMACVHSRRTPTGAPAEPAQCERMRELALENTTITVAERVTGGTFAPPGARDSIRSLPPFCRVAGGVPPPPPPHHPVPGGRPPPGGDAQLVRG